MFEIAFPLSLLAFAHSLQSIWRGHVVAIPLAILSAQTLAAALAWKMGFITTFAMTWSRGGQVEFGAINVAYFFATYLIVLAIYLLKRRHPAYHYSVASFTDLIRKRKENRFPLIALMLLAFSIYHFSILDLEVIFRNSQYILMSSPAVVVVKTPINIFVHAAQGLVGLIVIVYLSISIVNRRWGQVLILFPPAIWFLVFNITAHSRLAVVYAVFFALPLFLSGKRSHKGFALLFFAFAFLNLVNSLNGRGSSDQGLSAIFNYFDQSFDFSTLNAFDLIGNVVEGVFVQGDGFFYSTHDYPLGYKLTALSPLPSFIDGYSTHYIQFQLRHNRFVPFGATTEIRLFGIQYVAIYFSIMIYAYLKVFSLLRRKKFILFLISISVFSLATYLQFTYPTRNTIRFFYLIILLNVASHLFGSVKRSWLGHLQKERSR